MTARPRKGDTEDDLLAFQQQFLARESRPSATVVRATKDGPTPGDKRHESDEDSVAFTAAAGRQRDVVTMQGIPQVLPSTLSGHQPPPRKKSKFKEKRDQQKKTEMQEDYDAAELLERHDRHVSNILSQIKERDISSSASVFPTVVKRGFPEVLHRGNISEIVDKGSSRKGKSLFAQQFMSEGPSMFGIPASHTSPTTSSSERQSVPSNGVPQGPRPSIISGEGLVAGFMDSGNLKEEVGRIHAENVSKLEAMSKEDIIAEQARLKASLDPGLLSFLKSRRDKSKSSETSSRKQEKMDIDSEENKQKGLENHCTLTGDTNNLPNDTEMQSEVKGMKEEAIQGMEEELVSNEGKHVHFAKDVSVLTEEGGLEQLDAVNEIMQLGASAQWIHMNKVEPEKLEWMKECPTPSALEQKGGNQARFVFDGSLVTRDADIPVNLGLHHHGDDPSAAGYTLEELFTLCRSSFLQQRVLALHTLARIIAKDIAGAFCNSLQAPLLPTLLEAGVVFLLRWALDDSTDSVMAAAVQGIAALLVVPSNEVCADKVFEWYGGNELPSLRPLGDGESKSKDDEEEKHPTDAELVKQDVIKGLIQMRILPRLRYVLEVCRPSPVAVRSTLAILTRISRHSAESAHEVTKCPRLMETIFRHFLPVTWKSVQTEADIADNVYDIPLNEAMKLMRVICTAGRYVTTTLISKHNLIERVLRYTALHPSDIALPYDDAVTLYIESVRTWTVCIRYGLACHQFRDTYTMFIQYLRTVQEFSLVQASDNLLNSELKRACAMLRLLEAVIHVAGSTAELHAKMTAGSNANTEAEDLPPPPVNWSHVTGFLPLIGCTVGKWAQEVGGEVDCASLLSKDTSMALLSAALDLIASFYSKLPGQPSFSPVDSLQDLEELVSTILVPLTNSIFMTSLIQQLRINQLSTNEAPILLPRGPDSLPNYGSTTSNPQGPAVALMTSFLRLLCAVFNVHKGMTKQFLPFVTRPDIAEYLREMGSDTKVPEHSAFSRIQHHLQYFMVKLFYNVARSLDDQDLSPHLTTNHTAALVLFSRLRTGDEYYAHDLMTTVLFNPQFYPESKDLSSAGVTVDLSELSIKTEGRPTPPQPVTTDSRHLKRDELLGEAHKNLLAVRSTYVGSFGKMRHALAISRTRALHQPHDTESLLLSPSHDALLPVDWMFTPILDLHNQLISAEMKGRGVDEVPVSMVTTVTCALQLILLLEEWRPVSLRSVTMVARLARLTCIFLTGSDLFLNPLVHGYVSCLLHSYTRPHRLEKLDFSQPVPGLTSFHDLYTSLLSHYSAVSYGDPLFGCFVVLPLAQAYSPRYRHALWDEHKGTLRSLSLPINQVPIPLERYLYPVEQDFSLLNLYLCALATQTVRPQWSPLFYLLAVHHVNAFIYQRIDPQDSTSLKKKLSLLGGVMFVKQEDVKHDLLYYYKPAPDSSSAKAFELFTSLPPDREILLRNRDDVDECRKLYVSMATNDR